MYHDIIGYLVGDGSKDGICGIKLLNNYNRKTIELKKAGFANGFLLAYGPVYLSLYLNVVLNEVL